MLILLSPPTLTMSEPEGGSLIDEALETPTPFK